MGDPVTIPENIFLDKVYESASSKGKMTVYSTSSYVLKTIPFNILQVVLIFIAKFILAFIGKNKKKTRKILNLVNMLEWYVLETSLIDIFFYATIGLKIGNYIHSPQFWIDRGVSFFLLSWAIFKLLSLFFKIKDLLRLKTTGHMLDFEKETITEGINPDSYNFVGKSQEDG